MADELHDRRVAKARREGKPRPFSPTVMSRLADGFDAFCGADGPGSTTSTPDATGARRNHGADEKLCDCGANAHVRIPVDQAVAELNGFDGPGGYVATCSPCLRADYVATGAGAGVLDGLKVITDDGLRRPTLYESVMWGIG